MAVAILLVAGGGAALWVWSGSNTPSEVSSSVAADPILAMPTGPTVAVLPFDNLSGNRDQEYFSDGITEEVLTALSRFRNLHVVARNTTFQYKGMPVDVVQVGRETGAQYVLEGSVRRAGDTVRVTAQLVDSGSGSHLWAQTYDRAITPANLFEVQDDIAAKVGAAVAALYGGAISTTGLRTSSGKPPESLSSYDCVLEAFGIWRGQSAELVERSRDCLVMAVERDPDYADAWAMLSLIYQYQRWYGWGLEPPESHDLDQRAHLEQGALEAAQKAVKLAPDSATANFSLAWAYWTAGEIEKFRAQTERTLALNPHDPSFLGSLGNYLAYAGQWDEGVAMVEKAIALAPTSYATWWLWAVAKNHFRLGDYDQALIAFEGAFIPGLWLSQLQLAYTHGMLGNTEDAAQVVAELRELMPGFSISDALAYYRMWNFEQSYLDRMAKGLRRAGLPKDPPRPGTKGAPARSSGI